MISIQKNKFILLLACLLYFAPSLIWANDTVLKEIIRRKAEEAAMANCQIGGKRVCARQEVLDFYEHRLFEPAWKSPKHRQQLLDILRESAYQALTPADYYYGELLSFHERFLLLSLEDVGNMEILYTDAMLLYASHIHYGKVNSITVDPKWHVVPEAVDLGKQLSHALAVDSLTFRLQYLGAAEKGYLLLQKALLRYESLKSQGGWKLINATETLEVGSIDSAVFALRKRLFASQDLPAKAVIETMLYDSTLCYAVEKFQKRNGLTPDGRVGKETLDALNISIEERIMQIKINLERWRWLPKTSSNYLIKANIPDFQVEIIKNGKVEKTHRIIVGKSYRQTPVFTATMKYIVLNPTWTVPPTILSQDILPAVRKNTNYLKKKNITVYDASGNKVEVKQTDWNSSAVYRYTYRQSAGSHNALGRVKFMFPNPYSVYLHDTPSRELFDRTERAFSSGCMRVENPLELASYLLKGQDGGWSLDKINQTINSGVSQSINLEQQPEVLIVYFTAWADTDGSIHFRKDIYERDAQLQKALWTARPSD